MMIIITLIIIIINDLTPKTRLGKQRDIHLTTISKLFISIIIRMLNHLNDS